MNTVPLPPLPGACTSGLLPPGPAQRLAQALRSQQGEWLWLRDEQAGLDAADARLLQLALSQQPSIEVLSPIPASATAPSWESAPRVLLPASQPDFACSLWRRAAAQALLDSGRPPRCALLPGIHYTTAAASQPPAPRTRAGRDGRPVVLHLLHGWGGGAWRFVDDLMRHDPAQHHLALIAHGDRRGGWGRHWSLHADPGDEALRQGAYAQPIADVAIEHREARERLAELIDAFGISELRVSSLIGHSLDALRTGLPTRWVVHDLLPFWPLIEELDEYPGFDPTRLEQAASSAQWPFSERSAAVWSERARACAEALCAADAEIIAPSHFALTRLRKLGLPLPARQQVLAHGLPAMTAGRDPTRRPGPLRVLVPGRLAAAKGERLLDELLPMLAGAAIDWCFAGGGARAQRYAAATGGEALAEYRSAELQTLVERFDPDLALLPSSIPETFGYVLSEMAALGVGVLALRRGAYAERLAGQPGALADDAEALATLLHARAAGPERQPAPIGVVSGMETVLQAWRQLGPAPARDPRFMLDDAARAVATLQHELASMGGLLHRLAAERNSAWGYYDEDTADLIRQRDTALQHSAATDEQARQADAARLRAEQQTEALRSDLDRAYAYYERDTRDLARQRDTALTQRDAALAEVARLAALLERPWIRLPLRFVEGCRRSLLDGRYRLHQFRELAVRGARSLRQRGWAATWAAARRRWFPAPAAAVDATRLSPKPLAFVAAAKVRTSIVIPVFGKLDYTLACLQSLADGGLPEGTELIVIDDASPDDTAATLAGIPGLRWQRNPQNLGFVGSCNAGAALARGEFLVILNNDTTPVPGWIEALLRTFETHPDTGLAGAMLVYPDGRLQESGGIVFADGTGWNYGRFEDPRHPAYTFVREVDYCSGAAIALRRELFERLGGFDARYAPAYYEDTDLAMKVRDAGLKVRVQPAALVIHHEGITAGTDTTSGVKAYQVRNRGRFLERWGKVLAREHPAPTLPIRHASQHRSRAEVLVIDATTPMPDRDSGSLRMFELLRLLVEDGCAVTFFAENGLDDGRYTLALRQIGVEAWCQPWLGSLPDWLEKQGARFQAIVVSRHYVLSPLLPLLRRHAPQARIVFDSVDLHHLREQREAERSADSALARSALRTREIELGLVRDCDLTWVVSPFERELLRQALPQARVEVLSNIHHVRGPGPARERRHGLLFVGGYRHPPNIDAVRWLVAEILPGLRRKRPDIGLTLVGSDAPEELRALDGRDGIRVLGQVEDLTAVLDAHRISLAPLRYGAGVKGKINTALAHGLPVVATRCAIEGMALVDGADVLVADEAGAFIEAVLRLYDDEALWQRLVEGGLANTAREFSPARARQALAALYGPR